MADIRINLLPWREMRREEKKKEFSYIAIGVVVAALAIVGVVDRVYSGAISTQKDRNTFLTREIKTLEERIAEIQLLQQKRNELLSRMQVIQELQGNRPIIVRLFDELAEQLAPRVHYRQVVFEDKNISIQGVAESNNRISSQLRNFNESEWFESPNVTAINADENYGPTASQFTLTVRQSAPKKEEVQ